MNLTDITPRMVELALERTGLNLITDEWVGRDERGKCGCVLSVLAIASDKLTYSEIDCSGDVAEDLAKAFAVDEMDIEGFARGFDGMRCIDPRQIESFEAGRAIRQHFIAKGYML